MFKSLQTFTLSVALFASTNLSGAEDGIITHDGKPLTEAEIEKWQMTVFPDGRNLPEGEGTTKQGEAIYNTQCISCHGVEGRKGIGPRLSGKEGYINAEKQVMRTLSVGAWPYATTIFDYIRRAMPHHAPKSLSDSHVYALTAYILYLNGVIDRGEIMDRHSLASVEMPNRQKIVNVWELEQSSNDQVKTVSPGKEAQKVRPHWLNQH